MKVSIIMGSTSDYEVMNGAEQFLADFGIEYETRVISAHRTPDLMFEYTKALKGRGFGVVIAGAGGAAHLAGVAAGLTPLPVIAVPMQTKTLGAQSLLLKLLLSSTLRLQKRLMPTVRLRLRRFAILLCRQNNEASTLRHVSIFMTTAIGIFIALGSASAQSDNSKLRSTFAQSDNSQLRSTFAQSDNSQPRERIY